MKITMNKMCRTFRRKMGFFSLNVYISAFISAPDAPFSVNNVTQL